MDEQEGAAVAQGERFCLQVKGQGPLQHRQGQPELRHQRGQGGVQGQDRGLLPEKRLEASVAGGPAHDQLQSQQALSRRG